MLNVAPQTRPAQPAVRLTIGTRSPDIPADNERSKDDISMLWREMQAAGKKIEAVSNLVKQKIPTDGVASQEEVARGLMAVTRGLEVCEKSLEQEVRSRKAEISSLTQTINDAATKLRSELTDLHRTVANSATGAKIAEIPDVQPAGEAIEKLRQQMTTLCANEVSKLQEDLITEQARLARRCSNMEKSIESTLDSQPWLAETQKQNTALSQRLEVLEEQQQKNWQSQDRVLSGINSRLLELSDSLSIVQGSVQNQDNVVSGVNARLLELSDTMTTQEVIRQLNSRHDEFSRSNAELMERLASIERQHDVAIVNGFPSKQEFNEADAAAFGKLSAMIETLSIRLDAIDGTVEVLEENEPVDESSAHMSARLTCFDATIAKVNADVLDLTERVEAVTGSADVLAERVPLVDDHTAQALAKITDFEAALSKVSADVTSLSGRVDAVEDSADVLAERVPVDQNSAQMSNLLERIEGVERSLPAAAERGLDAENRHAIMELNVRIASMHDLSSEMSAEVARLARHEEQACQLHRNQEADSEMQHQRLDEVLQRCVGVGSALSGLRQKVDEADSRVGDLQQEVRSKLEQSAGCVKECKVIFAECNSLYSETSTYMQANATSKQANTAPASTSHALSEFQKSMLAERTAREAETERITNRIDTIVCGKDPQIEASFERLAAEIRASCMMAFREEIRSLAGSKADAGMELPRAGEQWIFTGNVSSIDVFSNSDGKQKIHGLVCHGPQGKLRRIDILTTATNDARYVHFRGTHNMNFMQGWSPLCDENGKWNIMRFDPAKFQRDTWL